MDGRTSVQIIVADPVVRAGIDVALRESQELTVVADAGDVALVAVDEIVSSTLFLLRSLTRGKRRVLLVARTLDITDALHAFEAGVLGLLRRRQAGPDRLCVAVRAVAHGEVTVPPDLLCGLLQRAATNKGAERPPVGELSEREKAVLLMLADGHETEEIARSLAYSVRTVTGIVHGITQRLQLRNRAHAVAYALREGLI